MEEFRGLFRPIERFPRAGVRPIPYLIDDFKELARRGDAK
jgi:hypothetical protein